jgi:hypothetical protein
LSNLTNDGSWSVTQKSQADKFRKAARQIETHDDEERFQERLNKLVKQTPGDKASDD